ncbi:hypothetical protein O3P69_006689 [Scylla paramamosain]|uniref:Protein BUD31 homolog n=2 Tax=Scylla TaxID=6760 RepID=A0AAW0U0I0_SCYPA
MDRIESLIDMEENEEYGGVRWENPEQGESEVNANQSFHAISPSHDKYPCEVNLRVEDTSSQVCHTRIENELEPQNDVVEGNGTRAERLRRLINQQNWAHLANDQQKQLSNVVLSHEKLFMLEKKDIGTISGEPAHIAVSDPNPCQSPMYLGVTSLPNITGDRHCFSDLMPKVRRSRKPPPEGWELIEPTLEELDQKMREAETESHEGKRKVESLWPIFRIHHQRSRYIYDLFYRRKAISRELYEYCLKEKIADQNLIAKWRKQGYENLCCLRCIQSRDTNFGTNCVCRVPKSKLEEGKIVECVHCGCRGCSG